MVASSRTRSGSAPSLPFDPSPVLNSLPLIPPPGSSSAAGFFFEQPVAATTATRPRIAIGAASRRSPLAPPIRSKAPNRPDVPSLWDMVHDMSWTHPPVAMRTAQCGDSPGISQADSHALDRAGAVKTRAPLADPDRARVSASRPDVAADGSARYRVELLHWAEVGEAGIVYVEGPSRST